MHSANLPRQCRQHARRLATLLAALLCSSLALADDTAPPLLVSASPADGSTGIKRSALVIATFDEALDPASITNDSLRLACDGMRVQGTVSYSNDSGPRLTLTPSPLIQAWRTCTAKIPAGGVRDLAGNASVGTISWSFRTAKILHNLNVAKTGNGSGRVYGAFNIPALHQPGIDCGATCSKALLPRNGYKLQAVADPGSAFIGWQGCPQPTGTLCKIPSMANDRTVTARFTQIGSSGPGNPDYWPTAGYFNAAPEDLGFVAGAFDTLAADADAALPFHSSLVIVKDGYLLHESFHTPPGSPEVFANTKHNVWSVTKSVTSMTLGTAWQQGHLDAADLDRRAGDAFAAEMSDLAVDAPQRDITLRNALQMRSGLRWNEGAWLFSPLESPLIRTTAGCSGNTAKLCSILHRAQSYTPGTVWNYNTFDSYLASAFFLDVTGQRLNDYAAQHLFAPLGIDYVDGDWATFPTGSDYTFGGGLLQIKSTDLARLGMLMLYEGRWNQAQIVAPDWYTLSLTPIGTNEVAAFDPVTKEPVAPGAPVNVSYGLHWWLARGIGLPPDGTITAIGLGGQLLVVYPEKELVIVVTCDASPDDRKPAIEAFLRTHVIDKLL